MKNSTQKSFQKIDMADLRQLRIAAPSSEKMDGDVDEEQHKNPFAVILRSLLRMRPTLR